jgi:DNA-directed RNA polymerase subunit K
VADPLTADAALAAPTDPSMSVSADGGPEATYSRFERARILGARALQISLGAPILIDVLPELIDPVEIAEREFAEGVIPITVRRGPAAP